MRQSLANTLLCTFILVGCSKTTTTTTSSPTEAAYCSSTVSYSGSTVTITGVAEYTRREYWGDYTLGGMGGALTTSLHPATIHPIRHAEVRVLGASGNVVQCTETDGSGNFSFVMPQNSSTYTVAVDSRSYNDYLKASVLTAPSEQQFYSLTSTFTPDATKTLATMNAAANGDVLGGAFNILDQLHNANDYLRLKVGNCSVFTGCADFQVAVKVSAYWKKGFNPNSYFGGTSGLSYYLPGYHQLFILGGIDGDVDSSDTDHFDNSVIIHEYGHFLEDTQFKSDSPGGSHNGNKIIDPRLAWSEGWGNFFQAAVRGQYEPETSGIHYIDTIGNDDGTTDMAFYVDLETPDGHDNPTVAGEGNFREFAVTRFLEDIVDTTNTDAHVDGGFDDISDQFIQIWASLAKTTTSFKDGTMAFRNVGLLHLIQENLFAHQSAAGASDFSNVRKLNRHDGNESHYGQYVTTSGTCASPAYSFSSSGYNTDSGSLSSSNLFSNNRFYHLRIATAGTYTIRLDYQDADGTGAEKDLDLYLYNSSARFATSSDIVAYSRNDPDGDKTTAEYESVTATLAAGDYLIDVYVYSGGAAISGQVNYTLKLNGSALCPDNLVPL